MLIASQTSFERKNLLLFYILMRVLRIEGEGRGNPESNGVQDRRRPNKRPTQGIRSSDRGI